MPKRFDTAVVIGKFYPPHRGHKLLVETALAQAERVTVFVVHQEAQSIPGALREKWMKEIHPAADVRLVLQTLDDDDTPGWAAWTVRELGYVPDAAFTSEEYGPRWAKAMGCAHVMVDNARVRVPVSGTAVRANPYANWEYLEPCVRAHFAKRVCVLGAESTGTTTMARALAEHYRTAWVPEYGRFYSEGKYVADGHVWTTDEFAHIARIQSSTEDWLARSANKVLVCDTDSFATTIWHERYMGVPSAAVREIADARRYDLYLLTGDEIPFEQDGVRDGEHLRHWMHGRFEEALRESGRPFAVLRGPHEDRLRAAVALVDTVMAREGAAQAA
ncbi:MAG: hypothetical protein RL272_811 [Candidatus Parcubacteria bacterium]|jgi:NadR type nicotinamide-nucleotide adenylyltransferase